MFLRSSHPIARVTSRAVPMPVPILFPDVAAVIREFAAPDAAVTPDAALFRDLGLKSTTALPLLLELETRFALTIPDADFARVRTVGDLVALVTRLAGKAAP